MSKLNLVTFGALSASQVNANIKSIVVTGYKVNQKFYATLPAAIFIAVRDGKLDMLNDMAKAAIAFRRKQDFIKVSKCVERMFDRAEDGITFVKAEDEGAAKATKKALLKTTTLELGQIVTKLEARLIKAMENIDEVKAASKENAKTKYKAKKDAIAFGEKSANQLVKGGATRAGADAALKAFAAELEKAFA
jgi:hypothetical protein